MWRYGIGTMAMIPRWLMGTLEHSHRRSCFRGPPQQPQSWLAMLTWMVQQVRLYGNDSMLMIMMSYLMRVII